MTHFHPLFPFPPYFRFFPFPPPFSLHSSPPRSAPPSFILQSLIDGWLEDLKHIDRFFLNLSQNRQFTLAAVEFINLLKKFELDAGSDRSSEPLFMVRN